MMKRLIIFTLFFSFLGSLAFAVEPLEKIDISKIPYNIKVPSGINTGSVLNQGAGSSKSLARIGTEITWAAWSDATNFTGNSVTFVNNTLYEFPGRVGKSFEVIGGLGIFIQLGFDLAAGDYTAAKINLVKNSSYWSIGKWGSSAAQIASVGVFLIDYSLNKFGTTAIAGRYEKWQRAYERYNISGSNKRSGAQWRTIIRGFIEQARNNPQDKDLFKRLLDQEIKSYLNRFWTDLGGRAETFVGNFSGEGGLNPKLEKDISASYYRTYLHKELNSVFSRIQVETEQELQAKIRAEIVKLSQELNKVYTIECKVLGKKDQVKNLEIEIGKDIGSSWKGLTNSKGEWKFQCTMYAWFLANTPKSATLTVSEDDEITKSFAFPSSPYKPRKVVFSLGVADIFGVVTDKESGDPIKEVIVSLGKEFKDQTTNSAGKYLFKDIPSGEYTIKATHQAYEDASKDFILEINRDKKEKFEINLEMKPLEPSVKITKPKDQQEVENLSPLVTGQITGGGAKGIERENVELLFDGYPIDFGYEQQTGVVEVVVADLQEDVPTKAMHKVKLTAKLDETYTDEIEFKAAIRPIVQDLKFFKDYLDDTSFPVVTCNVYDEHSGPHQSKMTALLDGSPVRFEITPIDANWAAVAFYTDKKLKGGSHTLSVIAYDNVEMSSKRASVTFKIPGPEVELVKPVDIGRVVSGSQETFSISAFNKGDNVAEDLIAIVHSNRKDYASVSQNRSYFGNVIAGEQISGSPIVIVTEKNLGNPESGEPVICPFTVTFYERANPKAKWIDNFTISIYPSEEETEGGTVLVQLIHGTYMEGDWPEHTKGETVQMDGSGGSFTAVSSSSGKAVFTNIPAGSYKVYVPIWYTFGAQLGIYERNFTLGSGQSLNLVLTLKGSCPYLYSYDGEKFNQENDIYSTARIHANQANFLKEDIPQELVRKKAYTDYLKVNFPVQAKDGVFQFKLKEVREEISYTDYANLISLQHPENTELLCDIEGDFYLIDPLHLIGPQKCTDQNNNDITEQVSLEDSLQFEAGHSSSLIFSFSQIEDLENAKLVLRMKGWEGELLQPTINKPRVQLMKKIDDQHWVHCSDIYPRAEWDQTVINLLPWIGSKEDQFKIQIDQCHIGKYHLIDYIALDTTSIQPQFMQVHSLLKAEHSKLRDVTPILSGHDFNFAQMFPEEEIIMDFDKGKIKQDGFVQSFIFETYGYYLYFGEKTEIIRLNR